MQVSWVLDNHFIHKGNELGSGKIKEDELKLRILLSRIINSSDDDSFVFHAYSSLAYLISCFLLCKILGRNVNFVYDVHDIIEVRPENGFLVNFKYKIWLLLEKYAVLRGEISVMTVSRGLKRILERRYGGVKVLLVYNCSVDLTEARQYFDISDKLLGEGKSNYFVFFGTPERFPYHVCRQLSQLGISIDIYGRGMSREWLSEKYESMDNVFFKGEYNPGCLDFLKEYKFLVLHSLVGNDNNFKYSMPNKVFQAAAFGVCILVSPNFLEISDSFSIIPGFCQLLPSEEGEEMSRVLLEVASSDFSNYSKVYDFLVETLELSRQGYLKLVNCS
jgi:glycosyltransferase involved in cell wall biosynthesis